MRATAVFPPSLLLALLLTGCGLPGPREHAASPAEVADSFVPYCGLQIGGEEARDSLRRRTALRAAATSEAQPAARPR